MRIYIGATKQLDKDLSNERQHLIDLDSKVENVKRMCSQIFPYFSLNTVSTTKDTSKIKQQMNAIYGVLFEEEDRSGYVNKFDDIDVS